MKMKTAAEAAAAPLLIEALIETLRLALQRERGSFSNSTGGTPIRPLYPWLGPRWGAN
jgi:hypothetical protein